jgi:hypothetical protein
MAPKEDHAITSVEVENKGGGTEVITPITSAFAGWSRKACIKKFWRLYLCGLLASIGGMYVI